MSLEHFGQRLGKLIREKRKIKGLTQTQLAEDAFGTAGKTRRISELESGSVSNPHPRTIDPIISILSISESELESCANYTIQNNDDAYELASREAKGLLESIAAQFEIDQPDATLKEMDTFLRAKAAEWRILRDKINGIAEENSALAELRSSAVAALSSGKFGDVDRILSEAEEKYQLDKTLYEVRKHAEIRTTRGDACLFKGDSSCTLLHYSTAVGFLRPFDENASLELIETLAGRVYQISQISTKPMYFVCALLLESALSLSIVLTSSDLDLEISYRIGLAYRNEHENTRTDARKFEYSEALIKAVLFSRKAYDLAKLQSDAYKEMSTAICLANCLRDQGKFQGSEGSLSSAANLLCEVRDKYREDDRITDLLPTLYNNLGAIYNDIGHYKSGTDKSGIAGQALNAFVEARKASEITCDMNVWAFSQYNIAVNTREKALSSSSSKNTHFLYLKSISELQAASECFSFMQYPMRFYDTQMALADLLVRYSAEIGNLAFAEPYLERAVSAAEAAASAIDKDRNLAFWVKNRYYMASIFTMHASLADEEVAKKDISYALELFQECLALYISLQDNEMVSEVKDKIHFIQNGMVDIK